MSELTTIKVMNFETRYNTKEILAFHDAVLNYANVATAAALSCTDEIMAAYTAAVAALQKLVHQDTKSQYTALISEYDAKRDNALKTIFTLIDAYAMSPVYTMADAGKPIKEAIRLYRNAARSALASETVEVKGLLEVLAAEELQEAIADVQHLDILIVELKAINDTVEKYMADRSSQEVTKAMNEEKRAAAAAAYNAIVVRANASVVLLPSEAVNTFVTEVNNTIDRTLDVYNQRMGCLHAEKPAEETEKETKKEAEAAAKKETDAATEAEKA